MTRARSLSQLANSSVFTVATNNRVGIGSEIPTTKLDVDGALNVSGNAAFGGVITYEDVTNIDSVGIITARTDLSIADKIIHTGDTNTAIRFPAADTVTVETAGSERVRIKSDGTLHAIKTGTQITNAEQTVAVFQRSSASGTTSKISIVSGNGAASHINFGDTDDEDIGQLIYDHSNNSMQFLTNTSEKMRITSAGDLYIGGTSGLLGKVSVLSSGTSDTSLHLATSGGASNNGDATNSVRFTGGNNARWANAKYEAFAHIFHGNGAERARLTATGNFGVGTNNPATPLVVSNSGAEGWELGYTSGTVELVGYNRSGSARSPMKIIGQTFLVQTGNPSLSNGLYQDSDGNIGINETSPSSYAGSGHQLVVSDTSSACGMTIRTSSSHSGNIFFSDGTSGTQRAEGYMQYNHAGNYLAFGTSNTERMRIDSSGRLGLGTNNPLVKFVVSDGAIRNIEMGYSSGLTNNYIQSYNRSTSAYMGLTIAASPISFQIGSTEAMKIDSSGRALVGTSAARTDYFNNTLTARLQVEGINHSGNVDRAALSIVNNNAATIYESPLLIMGRSAGSTYNSKTLVPNQYVMGRISFQGADGSDMCEGAFIEGFVNGTPGANDMPGGLRFATTSDGGSAATERMRITSAGHIHIGKTDANFSIGGSTLYNNGAAEFVMNAGTVMNVNRMTNDGRLIGFYQNSSLEGDISVSGTTVSYNGAHLSRWSQLPGGAERTEILRGSVLSNLDEMCEWGAEDNEQLNRMQVSDVEGDRNVAGVFQDWDDDDDVYTNDFHCAMTGDFVIRIAQGTTVARGDLLMSAGDGTAKPQDDDIVRSKTIAKVTSTTVSATYSDGSYCVPCVLMAC